MASLRYVVSFWLCRTSRSSLPLPAWCWVWLWAGHFDVYKIDLFCVLKSGGGQGSSQTSSKTLNLRTGLTPVCVQGLDLRSS